MTDSTKIPLLEYRSALAYNREVFLIEHGRLLKAFASVDLNFNALLKLPGTLRDSNGKSHVGLLPLLQLFQRQLLGAFEAVSACQAYQGWVLVRPGIEAVLIVGKWVDDPSNASIWQSRRENPAAYNRVYRGKALVSKSLPEAHRLQAALSAINDDFVHANTEYLYRHAKLQAGRPGFFDLSVVTFDSDPLPEVHGLALVHLALVAQTSLLGMFNKLFDTTDSLTSRLDAFVTVFGPRAGQLASENPIWRSMLERYGAWTTAV